MIRFILLLSSLLLSNNLYSTPNTSDLHLIAKTEQKPIFELIDVTYKYEIFHDERNIPYCEGEISIKFYIEGTSSISIRKSRPYQQLDGKRIIWSLGRPYDLPQGKDTINASFSYVNPGTFFRIDYYNPNSGYYEPISDSIYSTNYISQKDLIILDQSNITDIPHDKCTIDIDGTGIIVNNPSMEHLNVDILKANGLLETSVKTNEHHITIDKSRITKGIHIILIRSKNKIILTRKIRI